MGSAIDDKLYVTAFIEGIDAATGGMLVVREPASLNDAVALAVRVSRTEGVWLGKRPGTARMYAVRGDDQAAGQEFEEPANKRQRGVDVRAIRQAQETEAEKAERLSKVRCYSCQEMGHYASKCPARSHAASTKREDNGKNAGSRYGPRPQENGRQAQ